MADEAAGVHQLAALRGGLIGLARVFRRSASSRESRVEGREFFSVVCGALLLLALSACREKSDQDLISALLDQTIAAANEKAAGKVVEHAAEDFKGPSGADVKDCRRILTGYFFGKGWLKVFEQSRELTVDGSTAKVKLDVIIAVGNEVQKIEDLIPTNGTHLLFDVDLEKISGEWKYKRAAYKHVR